MGNIEHPIDRVIGNMALLNNEIRRDFLGDDGVIDPVEQMILNGIEEARTVISKVRSLDRAHDLAVKQEGKVTDYTKEMFKLAGLHVEPLDAA